MNKKMPKKKLAVIVGPTASGKSSLALMLEQKLNGEIVSADARQVYQGMDIGTAKVTLRHPEKYGSAGRREEPVPQHLVDIRNPNEPYTVADFQRDAITVIHDIHARGKLPILVGGTGLYVNAVVDNLVIPNVEANPNLRKQFERKNTDQLFEILRNRDPRAAATIDPHNKRRIIRVLEIIKTTGTLDRTKGAPLFDTMLIGITLPREELYRRINARVDTMMQSGFLDEVRTLLQKYPASVKAFDAIGYRELIAWIANGETEPLEQVVTKIKSATRAYARRQLTWWRRDKRIHWIRTPDEAFALLHQHLQR